MSESKTSLKLIRKGDDQLPDGSPAEQVNAIIERPDAEGFVQSLDPHVLYRLIRSAGWDEAIDLIPLASPWQFQVFVDLDAWQKDRFEPNALIPWFTAILEETSDQKFKSIVRETDPELFAMFFKDGLQVGLFDEDGDPPPEFMNIDWTTSPDGVYVVAYPDDQEKSALLRGILDRLYHVDRVMAWTLLEAARWELMTHMEAEAYRWRTSRLEEFGFVSREEALEIYKSLNPSKFRDRLDEGDYEAKPFSEARTTNLPTVTENFDESRFYIVKILERVDDDIIESIMAEFVSVQNRTLLADGVEPGEVEKARDVAERTLGYASLGLEFLSRADDERALQLVEEIPIRDIFRVGFSMTWRLRKTIVDLRRRPTLTIVEGDYFSLLRGADRSLAQALFKVRPMFADSTGEVLRFERQQQIDDAAVRLAFLAFKQLWLFGASGIDPDALVELAYSEATQNEPPTISFDSLFATHLVLALLDEDVTARGLTHDELRRLPAILRGSPWGDDPLGYFEEETIAPIIENLPAGSVRFAGRWIQQTLDRLVDELERVQDLDTPEFFVDVLLIAG